MEERTELLALSCRDFAGQTASAAPTPGGGSAAAYAGTLGMALVNMVARLTLGKKKYAGVEAEVAELLDKGEQIRETLLATVQADADAFVPLAAAYALPAGTDGEKAAKAAELSARSHTAASIPFQGAQAAVEGLEIARRIAECGSRLVISDAGCGAALLLAAVKSFDFTVRINLGAVQDKKFVNEAAQEMAALVARATSLEEETRRLANERLL